MRKCIAILFFVICLSGCSSYSYKKGYAVGYRAGFHNSSSDLEYDIESIIDEKYYEGFQDGLAKIKESRSAAEYYAMDRSEFSPEEAMMVIDSYENGTPFWNDGEPASEEDYQNAARTLYYFYQYYYNGEFSHYESP